MTIRDKAINKLQENPGIYADGNAAAILGAYVYLGLCEIASAIREAGTTA